MLRNAKKSVEGSEGGRTLAPPAPEAAFSPEGTAGVPPVAARRGPGVSAQRPGGGEGGGGEGGGGEGGGGEGGGLDGDGKSTGGEGGGNGGGAVRAEATAEETAAKGASRAQGGGGTGVRLRWGLQLQHGRRGGGKGADEAMRVGGARVAGMVAAALGGEGAGEGGGAIE